MDRSLPPGPRYPTLIQGIGIWTRPLSYSAHLRRRYGDRFTLRLPLTPPFVVLTDPDEIKQVFAAAPDVLHPGAGARVLEPVVGKHSVILLDGAAHMEQRKLMLPAFHGERMERLAGLVAEVAEQDVAEWPRGTPLALHPRLQSLTLEIILRAVFGLDPGPRLDALRDRLSRFLAFGDNPLTLFGPAPPWLERLLDRAGPLAGFVTLRDEIDELIFELIEERRGDGDDGDDVLAMLLAARHADGMPMSGEEVRDELMTLLVAGHETTASTLAWTFEQIAREPRVAARLGEEIGAGDNAYVTATIQESLRRRPVLPNSAPRLVKRPIEIGGHVYPEGVCLVPNAYLVHHDPRIYPSPYEFRPERFLDDPPGTYTWIPFGGGRRRCLGASFAMLEMSVVLPAVLGACELEPTARSHERPRRRNITVRPAAEAGVTLRRRAGAGAIA